MNTRPNEQAVKQYTLLWTLFGSGELYGEGTTMRGMKRSNIYFLIAYAIALCTFVFAGYFFYADYTLHTQLKRDLYGNNKFHSDMTYIDLPRISMSLASASGDASHSGNVRMDITLEVENKYAAQVSGYRSRIADRLTHYTQTLDYSELARPHATLWLRPDLLQLVNATTDDYPVKDVIFRQLVVF